jgi:hypothetical protein
MNKSITVSCGICLAALALGLSATLRWGAELPAWLLTVTLSLVLLLSLVYGFTSALPRLGWLHSRPVRGAVLVCLGVAAIFIPLPFVIAALCIGQGTRMVWDAACQEEIKARVVPTGKGLARAHNGEIDRVHGSSDRF